MTLVAITRPANVELLILGAGWTSTFLIPLLTKQDISHAATSTTGRDGTYKFKFEHDKSDESQKQYDALPTAQTILVTFPLKGKHESSHLVNSYKKAHSHVESSKFQFIQLGSSGIFTIPDQEIRLHRANLKPSIDVSQPLEDGLNKADVYERNLMVGISEEANFVVGNGTNCFLYLAGIELYDTKNERAIAEDELLKMGGCVLNLSGLWGGVRDPRHWIDRVADTKEKLNGKTSLHLVHGLDVARAIIAVHKLFFKAVGQRWILTDLFVYDWWSLILGWAGQLDAENTNNVKENSQIKWISELMIEADVRALPRSMEQLGRCYDTREFWNAFELMPIRART